MRHQPILNYSGLTIVLDQPSRHDDKQLLSGIAGDYVINNLGLARDSIDIRESKDGVNWLPNTKVVLLLGQKSLDLIKPNEKILEQRGSPIISSDGKIIYIVSIFPQDAHDRRNYEKDDENNEITKDKQTEKGHQKTAREHWRFWLGIDIRKAGRILSKGLLFVPTYNISCYGPIDTITNILSQTKNTRIYLDIETDEQQKLTCIGLGFESHGIFVIPFKRFNGELTYDSALLCRFLVSLQKAFSKENNNTIVIHNSSFDLFVLAWRYRIPFPAKIFDTMLAWHRCGYSEVEKSLGHLITYFTDLPYHKNDGVFDPRNHYQEQQLWHYNANDIKSMMIVDVELNKLIDRTKGARESVEQVNKSIVPYLTMSYKGCRVDIEAFLKRFNDLERRRTQLGRVLKVVTGKDINPRSSKQVSNYLYEYLGLEEPEKDPTNEKTLLKILTKTAVPSIKIILDYRGCGKLASSLKFRLWDNGLDTMGNSNDNTDNYHRATCAYKIAGSKDFRLGSSTLMEFGPDTGYGTNMQNWHKSVRDLIVADPGKILINRDQAGAEAKIVAYLCRLGRFRSLFLNNIKPHVFVALHLFKETWYKHCDRGIVDQCCLAKISDLKNVAGWKDLESKIKDSDNWSSSERFYYIAKQVCHSSNYGIKAPTFQMNTLLKSEGSVALSLQECKKFLSYYHNLFPEIIEWHLRTQDQLKNSRTITNLFGFPRKFVGPWGEDLFKDAYAYGPQSTVACITHIAITKLQDKINQGLDLDNLINTHDGLLAQTTIGREKEMSAIMEDAFRVEMISPVDGTHFFMETEVQYGYNWGPFKYKQNEKGLS